MVDALELARSQQGYCAPNPSVGAVVVHDNKIVARGCHHGPHTPHAEVEALKAFTELPPNTTIYITLEPCCTQGRTPPCTDLLIAKKPSRVVFAFTDPNPHVSGRGAKILREAGIPCDQISLDEIIDFYAPYTFWHQHQRPFVIAKLAMSLDGKVAGENGARYNITAEAANQYTHQLRKKVDAILTTAQTVINDNPALTIRLRDNHETKQIFILDRLQRLSGEQRIFAIQDNITIFHGMSSEQRINHLAVKYIPTPSTPKGLDLEWIIDAIGQCGVHTLLIEAGPTLINGLLTQNLVQRLLVYKSPLLLGEQSDTAVFARRDFATAKQVSWRVLGQDMLCEIDLT